MIHFWNYIFSLLFSYSLERKRSERLENAYTKRKMPRSSQTTTKSSRKADDNIKDKPSARIKKSTEVTKASKKAKESGVSMNLSEAKQVLAQEKRRKSLLNKIRNICQAKTVLQAAPMLRLCRAATQRSVGDGVRIQAKAMVAVHNSVESLVVDLISAAKNYIPPKQKTIKAEHLMKALELPEFREPFRIIDGRMKLHEPKKRAVKAASS